jgi:hypothetical protein
MLSRVPVDEQGQFPVNAHLVSALATGFLFFNEVLFWLVAMLLVRDGRMALAVRFFWLAAVAALAVWGSLAFLFWKEKTARVADTLLMVVGLVVFGLACRRLPPLPAEMAVANVVLIASCFRGVFRKRKG